MAKKLPPMEPVGGSGMAHCRINTDCDGPGLSSCCYQGLCVHAKFCLMGLKPLESVCQAKYECQSGCCYQDKCVRYSYCSGTCVQNNDCLSGNCCSHNSCTHNIVCSHNKIIGDHC